jgi:hypothetical protein
MAYQCVVGNCVHMYDKVERCYWAKDVKWVPVEEHAYLDLCWYHQEVLGSSRRVVEIQGWDKI